MNIFKSKDGRFLQCTCVLLFNLLAAVKQSKTATQFYITRLGFGMSGCTIVELSTILINHFMANHTLEITRMLCCLLIYIQPTKYLEDDQIKNLYTRVNRQLINETISTIEKHKEIHHYLIEILEYDIKTLFGKSYSL